MSMIIDLWVNLQLGGDIVTFKNWLQIGSSLAVQWLGLGAFTAVAQVQSLVEELRSHKPLGEKKKLITSCQEGRK